HLLSLASPGVMKSGTSTTNSLLIHAAVGPLIFSDQRPSADRRQRKSAVNQYISYARSPQPRRHAIIRNFTSAIRLAINLNRSNYASIGRNNNGIEIGLGNDVARGGNS